MSMFDRIQAAEKPPLTTWRPEQPGDCIAGRILAIRFVDTAHGERLVVDIEREEEEEGEFYTIWATAVIKGELHKQKAEVGDTIGIKYVGQVKNYKSFIVLVEKNNDEDVAF